MKAQEDIFEFLRPNMDINKMLVWFMVFNATLFQLYRGGQFYWWRKPQYRNKNHRSVPIHWQTLSDNVVSSTPIQQLKWWLALIAQVVVNPTYDHDHEGSHNKI
jgi:hypothetical protein